MENDKPTSPRTIVRSVQNDLPEAAPSIVMSDTSVVSLPRESDFVKDHKSYVSLSMSYLLTGCWDSRQFKSDGSEFR